MATEPIEVKARRQGPGLALVAGLLMAASAHAGLSLQVQPEKAKPGDPVLITVRGTKLPPVGSAGERPLRFYPVGDGFQALIGLPVEQEIGQVPIKVSALAPEGDPVPAELAAPLEVVEPHYPSRELKVDSKFIEPPPEVQQRMKEDQAAFNEAYAQPFGPLLFTRPFTWPRPPKITAPFGDLRTFNGKKQSQHYGTDLEGRVGQPITAANDGVVVLARECYASGNTVVLHHGANLFTVYFHMSKMLVKPGDHVHRGDRLGLVGKTGRVTGPHLHWGAKVDNLYVDAAMLLQLAFSR